MRFSQIVVVRNCNGEKLKYFFHHLSIASLQTILILKKYTEEYFPICEFIREV